MLNCVIGYALFLRDQHFTEGELSRVRANLVCEKTLHEIAKRLELSEFLRMGEGELKTGGAERASILADAWRRFSAPFSARRASRLRKRDSARLRADSLESHARNLQ